MNFESSVKQTEENKRFAEECKVIDLKYEYRGYTGEERYAIVSELSEKELKKKYPEIIQKYIPFVLLSVAQGQVIEEFERNEDKFRKRQTRNKDILSFASDETERFHARLIEEDFVAVLERRETWITECELLDEALGLLTPLQKHRIIEHCVQGKTLRSIAQEEGICFGVVDRSVRAGLKKMKRYFELSKVGEIGRKLLKTFRFRQLPAGQLAVCEPFYLLGSSVSRMISATRKISFAVTSPQFLHFSRSFLESPKSVSLGLRLLRLSTWMARVISWSFWVRDANIG